MPEQPGRPILETLKTYLRHRTTLLLLDNCEHLIKSCAQCAETLLNACPYMRLLATSREALDVAGEATLAVPPLAAPASGEQGSLDALAEYEAVRLFADRAAAALPSFALTSANVPAVAQVCQQVDGMPLAIEMAAARIRLLRVEQIAERLNDRFQLLTGGRRTALPRHQSLAAVLDWSYELLSEPERILLRRLAVFAGGWTLEAAEQVCGDEHGRIGSVAVLDLLDSVLSKSLVVAQPQAGQEARFGWYETIRQYALNRLEARGETETTRRRHALYYRALAETVEPRLYAADERLWLDQVAADLDNYRAAVAWSRTAIGDPEEGLRLANALHEFWLTRGPAGEGLAWLEAELAMEGSVLDAVRVRANYSAGWLAMWIGDIGKSAKYFQSCQTLGLKLRDQWGRAWGLSGLGAIAWHRRDDNVAQALLSESLIIFRELEDRLGIATQLQFLAMVARARGDYVTTQAQLAESLTIFQQLGYQPGIGGVLMELGHLARAVGQDAQATDFYARSQQVLGDLGDPNGVAELQYSKAQIAHNQGDDARAKALLVEALVTSRDLEAKVNSAFCLAKLGGGATAQLQPRIGAKLLSAAAAMFESLEKQMAVSVQAEYDRDLAAARAQLDEMSFAAAWAEGQGMTTEQAIELALGM